MDVIIKGVVELERKNQIDKENLIKCIPIVLTIIYSFTVFLSNYLFSINAEEYYGISRNNFTYMGVNEIIMKLIIAFLFAGILWLPFILDKLLKKQTKNLSKSDVIIYSFYCFVLYFIIAMPIFFHIGKKVNLAYLVELIFSVILAFIYSLITYYIIKESNQEKKPVINKKWFIFVFVVVFTIYFIGGFYIFSDSIHFSPEHQKKYEIIRDIDSTQKYAVLSKQGDELLVCKCIDDRDRLELYTDSYLYLKKADGLFYYKEFKTIEIKKPNIKLIK